MRRKSKDVVVCFRFFFSTLSTNGVKYKVRNTIFPITFLKKLKEIVKRFIIKYVNSFYAMN